MGDTVRVQQLLCIGKKCLAIDSVRVGAKEAVGIRKLQREFWKADHFLEHPIMPGTQIIEGMGQTALAYLRCTQKKAVVLSDIERASFRKPVKPNQIIEYHVYEMERWDNKRRFHAIAVVNTQEVASAELVFALLEKLP